MTKKHLQPRGTFTIPPGVQATVDVELTRHINSYSYIHPEITSAHGSPELAVPSEMFDFMKIMEMGAKKHGANNWLGPNGKKSDEKSMCDSMFHHLAEAYSGKRRDGESGLDPLLHLACRALMLYTRRQKGLVHELDIGL